MASLDRFDAHSIAELLWSGMPIVGQAQQAENPVELRKKANELEAAGKYAEARGGAVFRVLMQR
jgi:hypothetical protein